MNDDAFIYDFKQSFDKLGEIDERLVDENQMNVIEHCSRKLDESDNEINSLRTLRFSTMVHSVCYKLAKIRACYSNTLQRF